jgi:hypothetical protein
MLKIKTAFIRFIQKNRNENPIKNEIAALLENNSAIEN